MDLQLIGLRGGGAFGDVWEAQDSLSRRVAVKIIRDAGAAISNARDHARALARATHPNVVAVYSLETISDPVDGNPVECVVMEWIEGVTLSNRLRAARFSQAELSAFGTGLIGGLAHVHEQGLAHGDLHSDNVMLANGRAKIIDILYLDSLAALSTASRDSRTRRDLLNLRLMLQQILLHSELDPSEATDFNTALGSSPTLAEIRDAWNGSIAPDRRGDEQIVFDHAYQRLVDDGFVEGPAYAQAIAAETPGRLALPLLIKLLDERSVSSKHRDLVRHLWNQLLATDRVSLMARLGAAIEAETPKGRWWSPLAMLAGFGREGWTGLSAVVRLRLEAQIINDVLAGRHDIYGTTVGSPGSLGTWVRSFWAFLTNRDQLIENLAALLRRDWYTQNYVGKNFMSLLPLLADSPERKEILIQGLVSAVHNDAKVVQSELTRLPAEWQLEVARRVASP